MGRETLKSLRNAQMGFGKNYDMEPPKQHVDLNDGASRISVGLISAYTTWPPGRRLAWMTVNRGPYVHLWKIKLEKPYELGVKAVVSCTVTPKKIEQRFQHDVSPKI
jgi:hypothetical protein